LGHNAVWDEHPDGLILSIAEAFTRPTGDAGTLAKLG